MLVAILGAVITATLPGDWTPPAGASSAEDVPAASAVSAADQELVEKLEPGARPCAAWQADIAEGVRAVLTALCTGEGLRGPARWRLYVVGGAGAPRRLARVTLGEYSYGGCRAAGALRVRGNVLPGEGVLEVGWGCRSGDGVNPSVELWRWSGRELRRIFRVPSGAGGADPYATTWAVWWRPLPVEDGIAVIEVIWVYAFTATDPAQGWDGEQRLRYRFDGSAFNPPAGVLLVASSWASSWLPPSRASRYAPPLAFDGRVETAWCARAASGPWISIQLAETTRLQDIIIVPGYAKSEQVFRDNARVARVRIQALGETREVFSFQANLADEMSAQRVSVPERIGKIAELKVQLVRIRPGRVYQDVCVSELEVTPLVEARP